MIETIFRGLKNSFEINKEFQGFDYADLKPEYLLKYQIAAQIKSDFPDFKIKFENSTEEFKQAALDINEFIMYPNFHIKWKIRRKGYIDIAVYDSEFKSIFPIEVKLVNPQEDRAIEDLVRLLEFLNGENIGTIKSGFFVYVFKERIFSSLEQIPQDIEKAKSKAQKLISKLTEKVKTNLDFKFFGESIGNYSNFDNDDEMEGIEPFDLGELVKENIHYIGMIIKIMKK